MAAEIKIHRGDQIGGCITEIYTKTTRILIDFGEDLPGSSYSERFHMDWGASADGKKPAVRGVFSPITMATTSGASRRCRSTSSSA